MSFITERIKARMARQQFEQRMLEPISQLMAIKQARIEREEAKVRQQDLAFMEQSEKLLSDAKSWNKYTPEQIGTFQSDYNLAAARQKLPEQQFRDTRPEGLAELVATTQVSFNSGGHILPGLLTAYQNYGEGYTNNWLNENFNRLKAAGFVSGQGVQGEPLPVGGQTPTVTSPTPAKPEPAQVPPSGPKLIESRSVGTPAEFFHTAKYFTPKGPEQKTLTPESIAGTFQGQPIEELPTVEGAPAAGPTAPQPPSAPAATSAPTTPGRMSNYDMWAALIGGTGESLADGRKRFLSTLKEIGERVLTPGEVKMLIPWAQKEAVRVRIPYDPYWEVIYFSKQDEAEDYSPEEKVSHLISAADKLLKMNPESRARFRESLAAQGLDVPEIEGVPTETAKLNATLRFMGWTKETAISTRAYYQSLRDKMTKEGISSSDSRIQMIDSNLKTLDDVIASFLTKTPAEGIPGVQPEEKPMATVTVVPGYQPKGGEVPVAPVTFTPGTFPNLRKPGEPIRTVPQGSRPARTVAQAADDARADANKGGKGGKGGVDEYGRDPSAIAAKLGQEDKSKAQKAGFSTTAILHGPARIQEFLGDKDSESPKWWAFDDGSRGNKKQWYITQTGRGRVYEINKSEAEAQGVKFTAKPPKPTAPTKEPYDTESNRAYLGRMAKEYREKSTDWIATTIVQGKHKHTDWDKVWIKSVINAARKPKRSSKKKETVAEATARVEAQIKRLEGKK